MTGVLKSQVVITVGLVKTDGALGMMMRSRCFAEKEVVGPEHMLGLDRETGIAVVFHKTCPSAGQLLRRRGSAADHVVLRSTAKRREETRLVIDLFT